MFVGFGGVGFGIKVVEIYRLFRKVGSYGDREIIFGTRHFKEYSRCRTLATTPIAFVPLFRRKSDRLSLILSTQIHPRLDSFSCRSLQSTACGSQGCQRFISGRLAARPWPACQCSHHYMSRGPPIQAHQPALWRHTCSMLATAGSAEA